MHRALADALDSLEDPDRATWHRAAAADGPDETLVADLDRVGARAEQRGGYQAAADAHERAADLTTDPVAKPGASSPPPATRGPRARPPGVPAAVGRP